MEKIIERCPECGNYTEGVPAYSTERKIVQKYNLNNYNKKKAHDYKDMTYINYS